MGGNSILYNKGTELSNELFHEAKIGSLFTQAAIFLLHFHQKFNFRRRSKSFKITLFCPPDSKFGFWPGR